MVIYLSVAEWTQTCRIYDSMLFFGEFWTFRILFTILVFIKLTKNPVSLRLRCGSGKMYFCRYFTPCFATFKDVVHSLEPGKTPSDSTSHQAQNLVQRSLISQNTFKRCVAVAVRLRLFISIYLKPVLLKNTRNILLQQQYGYPYIIGTRLNMSNAFKNVIWKFLLKRFEIVQFEYEVHYIFIAIDVCILKIKENGNLCRL